MYSPRPLFPSKNTTMVDNTTTSGQFSPKQLNLTPSTPAPASKQPTLPKQLNLTPAAKSVAKKEITSPKVLFKEQAISATIVDEQYKNNPLCKDLSNKDIGRVKAIVLNAQLQDTTYVLNYADVLSSNFAHLISQIFECSSGNEATQIGLSISTLLAKMDELNGQIQLVSNLPPVQRTWYGAIKSEPALESQQLVGSIKDKLSNIDGLVNTLNQSVNNLIGSIDILNDLFKANQDNFTLLNLHIIAGKIIVQQHLTDIIPKKQASVTPNNPFELQDLIHLKDCVGRFERKLIELEKISHSVLLNAPQIRLIQSNTKDTAERIKQTAQYIIPQLKTQCSNFISLLLVTNAVNVRDAVNHTLFTQKAPAMMSHISEYSQKLKNIFV